jgi:hypothetical protein
VVPPLIVSLCDGRSLPRRLRRGSTFGRGTKRRHDDTTKTFASHFDGLRTLAAPRFLQHRPGRAGVDANDRAADISTPACLTEGQQEESGLSDVAEPAMKPRHFRRIVVSSWREAPARSATVVSIAA